jgi:ribosomal protein S4
LPRMVCYFWLHKEVVLTWHCSQSWDPRNLFNLWQRSKGPLAGELDFRRSDKTLFQQRWIAKKMVRGYFGESVKEKSFKRWYLPKTLPDVRPRRRIRGDDKLELTALAGRSRAATRELKKEAEDEEQALAPVGSLMFTEIERRLDTFVFRCCLADSIWSARRYILHGKVKLNGVEVRKHFS